MANNYSCEINEHGISAPAFPDIKNMLIQDYQDIFGSDMYLDNDSMDGQLLHIFSKAINDCNNVVIQTYNSFSPTHGQGVGLSNMVKINGIERLVPTNSTVLLKLIGQTGTVINNGVVTDNQNQTWILPEIVTIPIGGMIEVTATAQNKGSITAEIGSITNIQTPVLGWQSVTNELEPSMGNPVETDQELRDRQTVSTEFPSQSLVASIKSGIANIPSVDKLEVYENDTNIADSNGIPAHSVSVVVSSGDITKIAETIAIRKSPGCCTYGTTSQYVTVGNVPTQINFYFSTNRPIAINIVGNALNGYTVNDNNIIKQQLLDFFTNLQIGDDVFYTSVVSKAVYPSYHLTNLTFNIDGGAFNTSDKPIAFNELAILDIADISITIT